MTIIAMCFQHEWPAIGGRIFGDRALTNGCLWQQADEDEPSDDELSKFFVALQHAGFAKIETVSPGRYWIAYRQAPSTKAPLVIRHTVRVWRDITGTVKQRSLISAAGAPVPRPGW